MQFHIPTSAVLLYHTFIESCLLSVYVLGLHVYFSNFYYYTVTALGKVLFLAKSSEKPLDSCRISNCFKKYFLILCHENTVSRFLQEATVDSVHKSHCECGKNSFITYYTNVINTVIATNWGVVNCNIHLYVPHHVVQWEVKIKLFSLVPTSCNLQFLAGTKFFVTSTNFLSFPLINVRV